MGRTTAVRGTPHSDGIFEYGRMQTERTCRNGEASKGQGNRNMLKCLKKSKRQLLASQILISFLIFSTFSSLVFSFFPAIISNWINSRLQKSLQKTCQLNVLHHILQLNFLKSSASKRHFMWHGRMDGSTKTNTTRRSDTHLVLVSLLGMMMISSKNKGKLNGNLRRDSVGSRGDAEII